MEDAAGWVGQLYQNTPASELEAGRKALMGGSVGTAVPKLYARGRGAKFWIVGNRTACGYL